MYYYYFKIFKIFLKMSAVFCVIYNKYSRFDTVSINRGFRSISHDLELFFHKLSEMRIA